MFKGIGTAIFTLLIVIVVIYLSYLSSRFIAKNRFGMNNKSNYMKVIDQMAVGQDRSVALIQTGANYYLIGIASNGITMIAQLEEEDLIELPKGEVHKTTIPKDFMSIMKKVEGFKNRKKE
jgi:flagellar biosynthetic protein FliO